MTPYERVHYRLEGKPVDKIPNLNILMAFAAKYINVSLTSFALIIDILLMLILNAMNNLV